MNIALQSIQDSNMTIIFVIFSYLLGSLSFGILTTKFFKSGDLRNVGSGNIGATNVLRTGDKKAAILTLILDGGKGYLALFMASSLGGPGTIPLAGLAVFLGHLFPIFHGFKGGKGVATFIGITLALNILLGLIVCLIWFFVLIAFKKSSVSALGCSLCSPILLFFFGQQEHMFLIIILVVLLWFRHRENIQRIISKSEPSISLKK